MNSIPAQEIKRLGISAVDKALRLGPVHVVKNNRPRYVVLTEEGYQELVQDQACLLYTSPSPRDRTRSRMPSSA